MLGNLGRMARVLERQVVPGAKWLLNEHCTNQGITAKSSLFLQGAGQCQDLSR